jgi:transketolase
MLQRDAFIEEITAKLATDKDIFFLSADFGAAALDVLRKDFPDNFIHCGISEQAMVDIATGLALNGKKVFCYAMAPFISLRALEQIKCGPGMMGLPVCFISVGIGLGYADAGPTHYITEDYACLRSIIGSKIYTLADAESASRLAKKLIENPEFAYVRLDRHPQPKLRVEKYETSLDFRLMNAASPEKIVLIGSGKMAHLVRDVVDEHPDRFVGVDLISSTPFPEGIVDLVRESRGAIVLDEQTPKGALGSAVLEACSERSVLKNIRQITLPEMYIYENGGRDYLLDKLGLNKNNVISVADNYFR